jgi:hypothetical protein
MIYKRRQFSSLPKRYYHVPASVANPAFYQILQSHNIPDTDIYSTVWHAVRRYTLKSRKPGWSVHKRRVGDVR